MLALASCSKNNAQPTSTSGVSDPAAPASMFIQSCSLGCSAGSAGTSIFCAQTNISPNSEFLIEFSDPIDFPTVTANTFQVVNIANGTTAPGTFSLHPTDAAKMIFRPSLTFDGAGNPQFGLEANATYRLRIPGTNLGGAGPFIRSTSGALNSSEMDCTLATANPILDPVPGAPTMTAFVTDTLDGMTGDVTFDPVTHDPVGGVPLDGATDIETEARIVLIFDDIMNPATIANLLTGQSSTMSVFIDPDGDLNTTVDQILQSGSWAVDVDQGSLLRTTAIFTPDGGQFPDGGTNGASPRLVVLTVTNQLLDLASNALTNPGVSSFSTVLQATQEYLLVETFTDNSNEDAATSGAQWGGNRLTFGKGGGSGRLGELHVRAGETLILDTDSQTFPLPGQANSIMSNLEPGTDYDPLDRNTWPTVTIDQHGQGFEFSRLEIEPGARLVLMGSRPGRVFARGELINEGVIDLSGDTPEPHVSNTGGDQVNNTLADSQASAPGGPGGVGGPSAGAGGDGADRMDMTGATIPLMINIGGIFYPGAVNDGQPGLGVGGLPNNTGGQGGVHYPPTLPRHFSPTGGALYGDAELSDMTPLGSYECRIAMVAGTGSGGSHALMGTEGVALSPVTPANPGLIPNQPPPTPGGDNTSLDLEAPGSPASVFNKRNLEFWRKHLRGGAGGGGGGTSVYGSRHNTASGPNCDQVGGLFPFFDHSAAGGGGGGGAVMAAAGRQLVNRGVINCRGGDGGSADVVGSSILDCTQSGQIIGFAPDCGGMAAPGGGGAGGAVRLQAPVIEIAQLPGRIDVTGGLGGQGAGLSFGGDGSPGLVRLEYTGFADQAADASMFGPSVAPSLPNDVVFNTPFTSAAILSIGEWGEQRFRPESFSGAQSCWMQPDTGGTFFGLEFVDDVAGAPDDLSRFGWNMDIIYNVPGHGRRVFPYRGIPPVDPNDRYDETLFPAAALGGMDFETYFGTTLNHDEPTLAQGSYVVVRFQGARGPVGSPDFCGLGADDLVPDSMTPFVSHPALLNGFEATPNLMRFSVVFDAQLANYDPVVTARVVGVSNFRARVLVN